MIYKKKRTGGNGGSKAPKWFQAYEEREQQRWAKQEEFNAKQEEFNKTIISRLDNLVKKNNLNE